MADPLAMLKNSFSRNSQKYNCVRMYYKRRSQFSWTLSISQILARKKWTFFNPHRPTLIVPPMSAMAIFASNPLEAPANSAAFIDLRVSQT
jgi:hypothetical protein